MKKIFMWLLPLVAICVLASCGDTDNNDNKDSISIKNIEVEGNLAKSASVEKTELNSLSYTYSYSMEVLYDTPKFNLLADAENQDTTTTTDNNSETTTTGSESTEEVAAPVVKDTAYVVLNDTSEFSVHFTVDNPKQDTIDQIQFKVTEGSLEIKESDGFKPFSNYKDGIVTVLSQNPSQFDLTFKTTGNAKIEVVALRIKGADWVNADQYSNLNVYKVDDIIEFVNNEYDFGYTFKTKNIPGVTVTAVTEDDAPIIANELTNVYRMEGDGTITINYDLKISDDVKLHCSQSKSIEMVKVKTGDAEDFSAFHRYYIHIDILNKGTNNENATFTFYIVSKDSNSEFILIENKKSSVDLSKYNYYAENSNITSSTTVDDYTIRVVIER